MMMKKKIILRRYLSLEPKQTRKMIQKKTEQTAAAPAATTATAPPYKYNA